MSKVITKFAFFLFSVIALSTHAIAQMLDFPIGFDAIPKTKLKGPVHTVLTVRQRGEKVFSTDVEVYDLNGRLIETMNNYAGIEIHSNSMVRLGGKSTFTYDSSGKLIKEKAFTPEGEYTGYENFVYDAKNRLIEDIFYNVKGKENGRRTYSYVPDRREVEATWNFYYDGRVPPPMKALLSFNEKGQWTKRTEYNSDGTVSGTITFEYDEQGNFVKEIHCCDYNYSDRYDYKFDKQGNWVERRDTYVQLNKQGQEEVTPDWNDTYRVITYYSDNQTAP